MVEHLFSKFKALKPSATMKKEKEEEEEKKSFMLKNKECQHLLPAVLQPHEWRS
jgi:hypothetical protein